METVRNYRAGLYERVSKKITGQEARSVAEQNAQSRAACKEQGWDITAHYADPGVSASRFARKDREEWERLRADVRAGLLDVVVLWEPSRGDRKLGPWADFLEDCREQRVQIYVTSHRRLYNMLLRRDWRTLAEEGVDAHDDSNRTSDRVSRAMEANLEDGRPHGRVPFGYVRRYNKYRNLKAQVPDPRTAWVVREVITRVAAGEPLSAIARDMAARHAPTPQGGGWSASLVRRLATSHAYAGRRFYDPERTGNGITYDGMTRWVPLIDLAVWQAARGRLLAASRSSGRPGAQHEHLLSYLASCGVCGSRLSVRRGRGVPLYFCKDRGCAAMRQDWLDAYVTGRACALLDSPLFWNELYGGSDGKASAARAEEAELKTRLAELEKVYIDGGISAASFGRIEKELQKKIADAHRRGIVAPVPVPLSRFPRGPQTARDVFGAWPVAARKEVLRILYQEIILLPAGRKGRAIGFDRTRIRMTRAAPPG